MLAMVLQIVCILTSNLLILKEVDPVQGKDAILPV